VDAHDALEEARRAVLSFANSSSTTEDVALQANPDSRPPFPRAGETASRPPSSSHSTTTASAPFADSSSSSQGISASPNPPKVLTMAKNMARKRSQRPGSSSSLTPELEGDSVEVKYGARADRKRGERPKMAQGIPIAGEWASEFVREWASEFVREWASEFVRFAAKRWTRTHRVPSGEVGWIWLMQ
jgi:hypothetical protein